jgi:hypothetical protein
METRNMRASLPLALGIVCGLAFPALAAPQVNQKAIDDVQAGRCNVARAAWWGVDPQESTRALQAAINSGAEKVIVEKMPSPWIVDRIKLAGNQELAFEKGVVVLAKKGAFHGPSDSLFSAAGKSNIKLTGAGARHSILQMRRDDYASRQYRKAEWRTVVELTSCTNVTISGLTLAESGGDGIYLGTGRGHEPCKNIVIKDVICDRNYRQGISVINAENLLIDGCVLRNTGGTSPQAGIDFEPNDPAERLVNCVMRNCLIENNVGCALAIYAPLFDATTVPGRCASKTAQPGARTTARCSWRPPAGRKDRCRGRSSSTVAASRTPAGRASR